MKASPRCPYCNTQGVKNIASQSLGPVLLIYCGQCGAIFGILPAPARPADVQAQAVTPAPKIEPSPAPLAPLPSHTGPADDKTMTPERAAAILQRQGTIARSYK